MTRQRTIRQEFSVRGIGLHTGHRVGVRVRPAPADTGVVFRRLDAPGFSVRASGRAVGDVDHATTIVSSGRRIRTIEHLLSALAGTGVDNVFVEVDGEEIPILDGSAAPFVALIHRAGIAPQPARRTYLRVRRTQRISHAGRSILVHPCDEFRISYTIDFPHPCIGRQSGTFSVRPDDYPERIAPARTFATMRDVEALRRNGLARGGSLENAIVLSPDGILSGPLRFADEFLRHKVLDCIGDFALLGRPLLGHVVVEKGGHALHTEMVNRLLEASDASEVVALGEEEEALAVRALPERLRAYAPASAAV